MVLSGAYFREGPHRAPECLNRSKSSSTQPARNPEHGGIFAVLKTNLTLGTRLHASLGGTTAPRATTSLHDQHPTHEFGVDKSGASQSMITDATAFKNYERAPTGDRGEGADAKLLPVVNYGRLRLLVDQEEGTFWCKTRQLMLEGVAHGPGLGNHSLASAEALAKALDAPMRRYPATVVIVTQL